MAGRSRAPIFQIAIKPMNSEVAPSSETWLSRPTRIDPQGTQADALADEFARKHAR